MKIREVIERDCCDYKTDLVYLPNSLYYFCKHCGRHFVHNGGSEPESPGIQPLPWPWEDVKPIEYGWTAETPTIPGFYWWYDSIDLFPKDNKMKMRNIGKIDDLFDVWSGIAVKNLHGFWLEIKEPASPM